MKVVYLGGANEVGASSILVTISGKNILLDCGIRQSKSKDKLPDFSIVKDSGGIDAIIISHAHMDHIGSLPLISKEYPSALIYMNQMTLDLARVLLYDSLKIMNYTEGEIPIFSEDDVLKMFDRVRVIPFQKETSLLDNITLTTYMAGHIAGASCIYLKTPEGTLFYTGDFSLTNAHTINGMSIPKLRPDVIISETTYGDKLHSNREAEEQKLVEKTVEIIEKGGKVLIPVFALGRSQEVILILKRAINKHSLKPVPIYIDGMVQNICAAFSRNPLYLKESLGKKILREKEIFYDDNVIKVLDDNMRVKIVDDSNPCIIVASSGMLLGGRSEFYASNLVESEKNAIILTGYQDEESNGRMLLNLLEEEPEKRRLTLAGKVKNVLCDISKVGLSAHADKQEIKSVITSLKPKFVILGHGEESIINTFAKELSSELYAKIYVPNVLEELDLQIKNPRKQIDKKLEYLFSENGDIKDFYEFIKEHYQSKLFTIEDLAYIYYSKEIDENTIESFTKELIDSPYFTQDKRRFFLFKIADELEIESSLNKELTNQDLEEMLKVKIKDFPYKKISFYRAESRIVVTFDFPRVIKEDFDKICEEFFKETNFTVEKNDNINNLACESVIREVLGNSNIDKISYIPLEEKFKVKVYDVSISTEDIEKRIGYKVELTKVMPKENFYTTTINTTEKMDQNKAFAYIDEYFKDLPHKPYKKGLKNTSIVLSFITYEIGLKYTKEIEDLSKTIGFNIELNRNANMSMIFSNIEDILKELNLEKIKNPSYLPDVNKLSIKLVSASENDIKVLKERVLDCTGLELIVN